MPHIHDKIDFTTSAYIVSGDRVLLRKHDKFDLWVAPGGHIELNEDPFEAVQREIVEETGLNVKFVNCKTIEYEEPSKDLPVPFFINRHTVLPGHEHIDMIYIAKAITTEIRPQKGEMNDLSRFHWFNNKEIYDPSWGLTDAARAHVIQTLQLIKKYE